RRVDQLHIGALIEPLPRVSRERDLDFLTLTHAATIRPGLALREQRDHKLLRLVLIVRRRHQLTVLVLPHLHDRRLGHHQLEPAQVHRDVPHAVLLECKFACPANEVRAGRQATARVSVQICMSHPFGPVGTVQICRSGVYAGPMTAVREERIARELRRLRGKYTSADVQRALGITPSKLSRNESCKVRPSPQDVKLLPPFYGPDDATAERHRKAAEDREPPVWWNEFVGPDWSSALGYHLELESEATRIDSWTIDLVPGLLQTRDYSTALMTSRVDVPSDQLER